MRILGLSNGSNGQGSGDVDFGLMMWGGTLQIYERGYQKLGGVALSQGDRLRVSVVGGVVKYSRNGVAVYTSTLAPTYPLLVDTSILTPGAQIVGTTISGTLTDVILEAPGTPVAWTDLSEVTASGSQLTKLSSAPVTWTSGAVSTAAIASGNGWVETTFMDASSMRILGLSNGNSSPASDDVDFGLMMWGGTLQIYERGVQKFGGLALSQGDRVRVSVEGGVVKYSRDGVWVYTSTLAPTYPLLVDTSILTPGSQIVGTTISGDSIQPIQVPSPQLTPGPGTFPTAISVQITAQDPLSVSRYTLDGSDPTTASQLYTAPLTIATTADLRVRGFRSGWNSSSAVGGTYQIGAPLTPPTFSPQSGTYQTSVVVSISAPASTTIRYTLDGTPPSTSSALYSGPLTVTQSTTLKAIAVQSMGAPSAVAQATYTIQAATPALSPAGGEFGTPQAK